MENHKIYKIILLFVLLSVFTVLFFFRVGSVQASADEWRVPSDTDWANLTSYVNGYQSTPPDYDYRYDNTNNWISKSLANTSGWNAASALRAPGNDQASNNATGFAAKPGGLRHSNGTFHNLGSNAAFWSSTSDGDNAWRFGLFSFDGAVYRLSRDLAYGFSVRLVRDYTGSDADGTIYIDDYTGNDGKKYDGVKIGDFVFTLQNLKETKYADGTDIPVITDNTDWANDTDGALTKYANNNDNYNEYGALYNWYAVNNVKGLVSDEESIPPIPPIPELPPLSSIYAQIPVMEYPVERHQFEYGLWWNMFRRHWYMWIDYPSNNIKLCIVDDRNTVFQPIGELSRFNKSGQAQTQGVIFYPPVYNNSYAQENNLALIQGCAIDYDGVPVSYFYQDGDWYESNQHNFVGSPFAWFDDTYSGNISYGVLNPNYDLYDTFASSLPTVSIFRSEINPNIYGYNDIFDGTNGHQCLSDELGDTNSWFAQCPIAYFDESIYKPLIVLVEDAPSYNPPYSDSIDDWLPFGEYDDWFPNEWPAFDYVRVALNSLGQRVHNLLNFFGKFFVPNPIVLASHMENVRIAFANQPLVNSFTVTLASILSSFAVGSSTLPSFDFTIFGVTTTLDFASMIPVFDAVRPIVQISLFIGTVFYLYKFLIRLIGEGANLPTGQPSSNTSSNNNN